LTVHFFELGGYFDEFLSFKSKMHDNPSLFEFHHSEILNVHDDKTMKNLCLLFIRSQAKTMGNERVDASLQCIQQKCRGNKLETPD
jgi:hypothetical protein